MFWAFSFFSIPYKLVIVFSQSIFLNAGFFNQLNFVSNVPLWVLVWFFFFTCQILGNPIALTLIILLCKQVIRNTLIYSFFLSIMSWPRFLFLPTVQTLGLQIFKLLYTYFIKSSQQLVLSRFQ